MKREEQILRGVKKYVLLMLSCIMMLGLAACGKKMNLNDYVHVEITGYEGYGRANVVFDKAAFKEDYADMELKGKNSATYNLFYSSAAACVADEFIRVELDATEGLSNGDTVTLKWNCDEENIKELTGYKVKCQEEVITVEGLEEIPVFDAFAGLKVDFSGISPQGNAVIVTDNISAEAKNLFFVLDKNSGLSNGDVVTVKINGADSYNVEYFVESCGAIPESFEKEFQVEGLGEYVTELSQIPNDMMQKMDTQARDKLKAYVAANWGDAESFKNMQFLGNYFLTPKAGFVGINKIYFIYRVTATNESNPEGFDYYYYTCYENLILLPDGTCSVDLSAAVVPEGDATYLFGEPYSIRGEAFFSGKYWYKGYEDLDSLFNKHVTAKIDEYSYESTVEE